MQKDLFYVVMIIQLIVQFVLYWQVRFLVFKAGLISAKITKYNIDTTMRTMLVVAFALNIIISLFVKLFTSSGAMTGITNLFASVILGIIMYFDIARVIKKLK